MATWVNQTENSATWTNVSSATELDIGEPIGLLLLLTDATDPRVVSIWTNQIAH